MLERQSRKAGHDPRAQSRLVVDVAQANGTIKRVDFTQFAFGIKVGEGDRYRKYPVTPRPLLLIDLLSPLKAYFSKRSPKTYGHTRNTLRLLWRFLDAHPHLSILRIADLTDVHGSALYRWFPGNCHWETYRQLKSLIDFSRSYKQLPDLAWPSLPAYHREPESTRETEPTF